MRRTPEWAIHAVPAIKKTPVSSDIPTFLGRAGQLLLEYNESTGQICRVLVATARSLTERDCEVTVSYDSLAVTLADEQPLVLHVKELRDNAALQARVHSLLGQVQSKQLELNRALVELQRLKDTTPYHPRWLTMCLLGCAAAALARLLGADLGSLAVAGVATSLGVAVRQELGRRQFSLLMLPFADYSGMSIDRGRVAIVSQVNSMLWIGTFDEAGWKWRDDGQLYEFPRDEGAIRYGNIEGVGWLSAARIVAVSDRRKKKDPPDKRLAEKDQSIHVFDVPT